jgi:ABC-type transport system involved in Fe-S cluster assembly fused permease/ATPase subunit
MASIYSRGALSRSLRAQIGIVHAVHLPFTDTIFFCFFAPTIAYGKQAPSRRPQAVEKAARAAHSARLHRRLAAGYDTIVGELA